MAGHVFFTPPTFVPAYTLRDDARRRCTMPQPPQSQAEMTSQDMLVDTSEDPRNDSVSSNSSSPINVAYDQNARRNSALSAHRNPRSFGGGNIRTRSIGGPFGMIVFERDLPIPTDEDIIIVTVKLQNIFRRSSVEGAESLPSRPPRRSFLRRISTRLPIDDHTKEREERYKAIKMPRGEYKRYFARDKDGNYAGTEPEKHWDEEELLEKYGEYQGVPLHTILC